MPINQRTILYVSVKSARYCMNMISAEKNAVMVTPARSSTVVESPRRRAVASAYTMPSAPSPPARLASGIDDSPPNVKSRWNVMAATAPNAAPLETPSVSGLASGFLKSA